MPEAPFSLNEKPACGGADDFPSIKMAHKAPFVENAVTGSLCWPIPHCHRIRRRVYLDVVAGSRGHDEIRNEHGPKNQSKSAVRSRFLTRPLSAPDRTFRASVSAQPR